MNRYNFWLWFLPPLVIGLIMIILAYGEPVVSQEDLTHPDFIDPHGVGWTILNVERDGIPTQILIETPFYELPPDYQQLYYKQLLEK